MNRLTLVYITIIGLSAAGLWGILRVGQSLHAPTDLSGVWNVGGEDPKVPELLGETVDVEQSGRFLRLQFAKGLVVDVKLKDAPHEAKPGENLDLVFEGPTWKLAAFGSGADGPLIFRLNGPERHTFTVTRHSHTTASSEEGNSTARATPVATENATADAGDEAATGTDAP